MRSAVSHASNTFARGTLIVAEDLARHEAGPLQYLDMLRHDPAADWPLVAIGTLYSQRIARLLP